MAPAPRLRRRGRIGSAGRPAPSRSRNHFVQFQATDNVGRVEAVKLIAFKADSDKPKATITRPKEGATFELGQIVKANFKCADKASGSGLASCFSSSSHPYYYGWETQAAWAGTCPSSASS